MSRQKQIKGSCNTKQKLKGSDQSRTAAAEACCFQARSAWGQTPCQGHARTPLNVAYTVTATHARPPQCTHPWQHPSDTHAPRRARRCCCCGGGRPPGVSCWFQHRPAQGVITAIPRLVSIGNHSDVYHPLMGVWCLGAVARGQPEAAGASIDLATSAEQLHTNAVHAW